MSTLSQSNRTAQTLLAQTIVEANSAAASADFCRQVEAEVAGLAPLASPVFTGTPRAPTATDMNNSTQLATTAYLDRLRGQANGLATLDGSGLIPASQLPSLALTTVYTVNSQAAMLALPANPGDLAVRTDISETFILAASPASTLGNWTELLFAAPVTSVAGLVGSISATDLTPALNVFIGDSGSGGLRGMVPAPAAGDAAAGKVLGAGGGFVVKADLASPTFTGTPTAPTATVDTNTGQIASVAFVLAQAASATPLVNGTAAPGTSTRYARADHIHPTDTSRAPLASPTLTGTPAAPTPGSNVNTTQIVNGAWVNTYYAPLSSPTFTGTPTAPTATPGTNTTQLATTAFVTAAAAALVTGVSSFNSRTGAVAPTTGDYAVAQVTGAAALASPTFTGTPLAPTATPGTNTTQIATTAFVTAAAAALVTGVSSFNSRTGAVAPTTGDYAVAQVTGAAPLASPTLTGTPAAPTAAPGTNTTQLATTAYADAIAALKANLASPTLTGTPAAPTPGSNVNTTQIPTTAWVNTYYAPLASPTFTGTPAAPTASPGTNTTQLASTAFVTAAVSAATAGVSSFNSRTGAVVPASGDYTVGQVTGAAALASPTFTGTPLSTTAAVDTNTTQIATTSFVLAQAASANPIIDGTAAPGTSTRYARGDHVHPTDTSRAPLASPTFTGTPAAPTPSGGDNTTKIATTAYVQGELGSNGIPSCTIAMTILSTAPTGWLLFADQTIGDASSGATYANALSVNVFTALYNNTVDADCPVLTSAGGATTRGAQGSAATAYAAHCRITMPKVLGRALAGAGAGSGLTSRALGSTVGSETTTPTQATMFQHDHPYNYRSGASTTSVPYPSQKDDTGTVNLSSSSANATAGANTVIGNNGSSTPNNNMQPTTFFNVMVKL